MVPEIREKLIALCQERVTFDSNLKNLTTFRIGGDAAALIEVGTREELRNILLLADEFGIEWRVIGKGSNLLISDEGFDGIILLLSGDFLDISLSGQNGYVVRAGAAVSLGQLVHWCQQSSLGGCEFLLGIPGSIGGASIMNAGAWGGQLSDILEGIEIVTSKEEKYIQSSDLRYSYRKCHGWEEFKGRGVVTHVNLLLRPTGKEEILEKCRTYTEQRKNKQPKGLPNAGSFFKNPQGDSAGRLIEASGLKGFRVGDAAVSVIHANFLVNEGRASSKDVMRLMQIIQQKVEEDSGVTLEPEVHFIEGP